MIEALQPSKRGSLAETNKNRTGKLAKSLGSLKSAGGERRWEPRGEASMAPRFSWKQQQKKKTQHKNHPSNSSVPARLFHPAVPPGTGARGQATVSPVPMGSLQVASCLPGPPELGLCSLLAVGFCCWWAARRLWGCGGSGRGSPHNLGACRDGGCCCCVSGGAPSARADALIPAFRREMRGPGHRRPAASPLMPAYQT